MSKIIEITDYEAQELDIYARLTEAQLAAMFEPENGVFVAESPKVVERALDAGCVPISMLVEDRHIETQAQELIQRCRDIPIYTAKAEVLSELTGFSLTRGMLCAMYRPTLPSVYEICKNARRIVVLEDVVNPTNVGAIFRSAAALHMDGILLTPGCSDPLYRRASRVSMGTVFQIPWTSFVTEKEKRRQERWLQDQIRKLEHSSEDQDRKSLEVLVKNQKNLVENQVVWPQPGMEVLKAMGFRTVALALRDDSVRIDDPELMAEEKLAILLGTEGDGLASSTITECDYTVKIPMSHGVDSLNVAAASAVAFWQLGKGTLK